MGFSFKYKSVKLKTGDIIHRPMIPLTIRGKDSLDIIAILDSGSDMTIIPKEIAEFIDIEYIGFNEISGISGIPVKAKQGKVMMSFGKGREIYDFWMPVLVPTEKENIPIVIGRLGFFDQFKITFSESEKKIGFKKINPGNIKF
ncbi:MAG TPA: hypothetical protein ENG87_02415 [Candidatus Pacearchaeota archaeon]|nr:hypothetical protein BMS3Abin17_01287 [archaeon BMS3Abin17]HDK42209.1 hypothetical protein [Candidatus Pacearchaeota archaeon]HDZ61498.1 hypothetical protein [Candidatus Pacearchaeota archaeon]